MVSFLQTFLPLVIYVLLIVLLIVGIILGIKAIQMINKVDKVVDDVNDKVQTLNGFFNLVDFTTDKIVSITDKVVEGVSGLIGNIFFKKKKNRIRWWGGWIKMAEKRGNGFGKFLTGVAIGVGLGILFAPKSGAETRKELKEKLDDLYAKAKDLKIEDVKNAIQKKVQEIKEGIADLDGEKVAEIAKDKAAKVKAKAEELYNTAKAKATPVVVKAASEVREKTIQFLKETVNKLENPEPKDKKKKLFNF